MTGKTHLAGGFTAAAALAWGAEHVPAFTAVLPASVSIAGTAAPALLPAFAAALFGSLLPDIDEPESLIANAPDAAKRRLGRGRRGLDRRSRQSAGVLLSALNVVTRGLAMLVRMLAGGHRGATHVLLIAAALSVGMFFLGSAIGFPSLWIWFAAGYLSHLLLDMMTPSGLAVLWPLSRGSWHLLPGPLRIRTGGGADAAVRVLLLGLAAGLLYLRFG